MKENTITYLVIRGCQPIHTLGKRDSFLPSTYRNSIPGVQWRGLAWRSPEAWGWSHTWLRSHPRGTGESRRQWTPWEWRRVTKKGRWQHQALPISTFSLSLQIRRKRKEMCPPSFFSVPLFLPGPPKIKPLLFIVVVQGGSTRVERRQSHPSIWRCHSSFKLLFTNFWNPVSQDSGPPQFFLKGPCADSVPFWKFIYWHLSVTN